MSAGRELIRLVVDRAESALVWCFGALLPIVVQFGRSYNPSIRHRQRRGTCWPPAHAFLPDLVGQEASARAPERRVTRPAAKAIDAQMLATATGH